MEQERSDGWVSQVRRAGGALDRPAVIAGAAVPAASVVGGQEGPVGADDFQVVHRNLHPDSDRDLDRVLSALRTPSIWLDAADLVIRSHKDVGRMRVIRSKRLRVAEISALVTQARATGRVVQDEVVIRRINPRSAELLLRVRVAPMESGAVLILIEDLSEAKRVDDVRRDFVANVSHELKTPVGGMTLLAEALREVTDDRQLVAHFAERMAMETHRLATLINDLLDLSRLEGVDAFERAEPVSVDEVIDEACADSQVLAATKSISLVRGGVPGLIVDGLRVHLVTAVRNLVANAINYSPSGTNVAITTKITEGSVCIEVTDQGIGLARADLERIFERFYRVDPARSRNTGGTGLGLAIVKHVCVNHGGDCTVWSKPREGSTFTMRLPQSKVGTPDEGSSKGSGGSRDPNPDR